MSYTVHQLAAAAGVSVRTLHYYDQIGLLEPAGIKRNGYRHYEQAQLERLQQILFFRELEFSLDDIRQIMDAPNFNRLEALSDQRRLLEIKKRRLDKLIKTITKTLHMTENNQQDPEKGEALYASLTQAEMDAYKEEARCKWGKTSAFKQSEERTRHWNKEDYTRVAAETKKHIQSIAEIMDRGVTDPQVQAKIAQSHRNIGVFYDCSVEMFRALGRMYVDDARFAAMYEKVKPGLAAFMRDAIAFYCDQAAHNSASPEAAGSVG